MVGMIENKRYYVNYWEGYSQCLNDLEKELEL